MKRGMDPFLVLNRTISSKSSLAFLNFFPLLVFMLCFIFYRQNMEEVKTRAATEDMGITFKVTLCNFCISALISYLCFLLSVK